jgi:hypothetical protein
MVNFSVIRAKDVAPEKSLETNIYPKISFMPISLLGTLSKNIFVLIWPFAIAKNTLC